MAAARASLMEGPVPFSAAVLCGGASRRMGTDKAVLLIDGVPMALRVADALVGAGASEVFAVGGDSVRLGALGLVVVADDEPGGGPLGAVLTALRRASHPMVAVLSCDLLEPSGAAVSAVVDALRLAPAEVLAAVPVVDGHRQWTHAVWRIEALASLEAAHAEGVRSLRRGAQGLPLCDVRGLHPRSVADADAPDDLRHVAGTLGADG